MGPTLVLMLSLDAKECIQGESVFFNIVLQNTSGDAVHGVPLFDSDRPCVNLVADGPDGRHVADQLSAERRNGVHQHGPTDEQEGISLGPGQKLTLRDDLLAWFGELKPGTYKLTAEHIFELVSEPVTLKVLSADVAFASAPRYSGQSPDAPFTAAWVHRQDGGALLFYQQQSPTLPRNPIHGIRVTQLEEAIELFAAVIPDSSATRGHVLWLDGRGRLQAVAIDPGKPSAGAPVEIDVPFRGDLLASALSMPNGQVFIPCTNHKKEKVAIVRMDPSGEAQPFELDLAKTKPLGPYVCFWEYDIRLHFAWAAPGGREIQVARLPLDDPKQGFVTRSGHVSDDPILWIDAYLDDKAAAVDAPLFEHQVPPDQKDQVPSIPGPKLMLWCVTTTPAGLCCTKVNVADNLSEVVKTLGAGGAKDLRVISSVVTYEKNGLAMLLADEKDRLYYTSTDRDSLSPLSEAAGMKVVLDDFPVLITSSRSGSYPWVYLRYVHRKSSIRYIRIDPADEKDPVEGAQSTTRPARRRR